ncbi:MAG: exodeoxyribonuclease VII small subunit [Clostridia bacterium]|nr:exodeoxyribonuclease VII small subunit [Clostridia bacterium]
MTDKKTNGIESYDLETAMKRLDEVVEGLSRENVSLEDSLRLYEEGVALVRLCNTRLDSVERKINALRMTADGEVIQEPFASAGE